MGVSASQLRTFVKTRLKGEVEKDPRLRHGALQKGKLTEHTLQAIIWDHLCRFVDGSWLASIEDRVPRVGKQADIVMCKLAAGGGIDARTGAVAIEVNPNGNWSGLEPDMKELVACVEQNGTPVKFGALLYMSPYDTHEEDLRSMAQRAGQGRVSVVRLER